jgi:AraC family transcriptional regulator
MEEFKLLDTNPQIAQTANEPNARPLPAAVRGGLPPHKLQKVLSYIDEKLAEPVGVRELASQVHMSPFHFARRFKQAVGTPPHAYITQVRIERAKRLLSTTSLPLIEVATRVGYRTQAHFTGVFHRYVGTTPRAYRVASRKELIPHAQVIATSAAGMEVAATA